MIDSTNPTFYNSFKTISTRRINHFTPIFIFIYLSLANCIIQLRRFPVFVGGIVIHFHCLPRTAFSMFPTTFLNPLIFYVIIRYFCEGVCGLSTNIHNISPCFCDYGTILRRCIRAAGQTKTAATRRTIKLGSKTWFRRGKTRIRCRKNKTCNMKENESFQRWHRSLIRL